MLTPLASALVLALATPGDGAALAAGPAAAAPPICATRRPAPPRVIVHPKWLARPVRLGDFYPEFRAKLGNACAIVDCRVTAQGTLGRCRAVAEKPAGMGIGRAAEAQVRRFRMSPLDDDGRPVAGRWVRVPIRFPTLAATPMRSAGGAYSSR